MGRVLDFTGGTQQSQFAPQVEDWYRRASGGSLDNKKYTYLIGFSKERDIKAAVIYTDYTGYSITMDVCAPRAMTRGLLKEMFDYPFNQLGVKRMFGFIDARNELSIRTFDKVGGKRVGEIKDFFGEGISRLVYTATKEDIKKWVI